MTNEERVDEMIEKMFSREGSLKTALLAEADAEHTYKVEFAKAFLNGEGTIDARKHQAVLDTEVLLKNRLTATATREFTAEALRDTRQALSARQSILKADTDKAF